MNPTVLLIIDFIQMAIQAAPLAKEIFDDGKAIFEDMFQTGMISADKQAELMAWCDAHQAAILAGQMPPEFVVTAPGPVTPPAAVDRSAPEVPIPAAPGWGLGHSGPAPSPEPAPAPSQPAPEVASAAGVQCPTCGKTLVSNHPENCNCVNA